MALIVSLEVRPQLSWEFVAKCEVIHRSLPQVGTKLPGDNTSLSFIHRCGHYYLTWDFPESPGKM